MGHPLEEKVSSVRRRARITALVYGICWTGVVFVLAALVAASLDYFLRVEYRPVRLMISLAALAAIGWGVFRYLLPQLRARFSDVAIAQRVQQRYPGMRDKMASAVEFLKQNEDDQMAGSPVLRRAVVVDTVADMDGIELSDVVDGRPAIRALAGAGIAFVVALVVVFLSPASARIALARLVNPLGDNVWPKVNHLEFENPPSRLASGTLFEVELQDKNGKMPNEVFIVFRYEEEAGPREIAEPMRFVDGVMVAHRENVRRPFAYRARGGDDETAWHELEVLEPPRVESLQVTLTPPAYSGWPMATSSGRIVGLAGTKLQVQGTVSKALDSAALVVGNDKRLPASISEDGLTFTIPETGGDSYWEIEQTANYHFELTDRDGIEGGRNDQYQIRAIADEAPTVNVEKPTSEIHVTAKATVPIRVLAKDRLAIRDIFLKYIRSDASDEGEQEIPLYQGPENVELLTAQEQVVALSQGDRRIAEYQWELEPLQLAPGTQITLHASAHDYQPAEGKSPPQRILVITERELEDRLARKQASILGELARALKRQKEARGRTAELEIQLQEVGQLEDQDIPKLQGLDLAQRDIRRALKGERDGILPQIAGLLGELENNKLDSPDMVRQMQDLSDLIRQLDREQLSAIESELTKAQKNVQANIEEQQRSLQQEQENNAAGSEQESNQADRATDSAKQDESASQQQRTQEAEQALAKTGEQQDEVVTALEAALGDLQRWDNYRRFARELAGIDTEQRKLKRDTEGMRGKTLGRDTKDLSPQDRADLKKIAEKQQELARRFDKLLDGMEKADANLRESDPLAAESISDATHQAREKGISGQMRSAGSNVARNQVGQAAGRQQQIGSDLQEMLDTLSNRREQELSRLVKKLREAESELQKLRKEQEGLKKKIKEANKIKDEQQRRRELQRLARQQRKVQENIDRLARRLQRLQANRASSKLADASGQMNQSSDAGEAGQGGQDGERAEQAQQDLEEAQQRLAQARRQAEADLAQEQLARLQDQLKGLVDREQGILDETQRLEQLRADQGRLTRGQLVSVTQLARQQLGLEDETGQMAKKLAGAEVFRLALENAAGEMHEAGEGLGGLNTGEQTQRFERGALARLALVIKALAPDKPDGQQKNGGDQGGAGQGGGNQGGGATIRSISELKLLKLMQEELNLRTQENDELIQQRLSDEREIFELIENRGKLATEQGKLADILFELLEPAEDSPESDPDKLPDLENDEPEILERDEGLLPGLDDLELSP